jgi:hypothetical protein
MAVARPFQNSKFNTAGPGRQPGYFLYWSKESNQRKDCAALGMLLRSSGALSIDSIN